MSKCVGVCVSESVTSESEYECECMKGGSVCG